MALPEERHYNINKLNVLFAVVSLVLLCSLGAMFLSDYFRSWKDYQRQFRALEIEKTRVKYDYEENKVKDSDEYQTLSKELKSAKKDFAANCQLPQANAELQKLLAKDAILNQKYKFTQAEYAAARYRYEAVREKGEGRDLQVAEREFARLEGKLKDLKLAAEDSSQRVAQKQKQIDGCGAQLKELQRKERALTGKETILERKLDKIDPNQMNFTDRIADMVRDLPVIDFANPNLKIQQIVLKDIHEDLNFAKVPRVDRCTTCHLGIDNPDYEDMPQPFRTHPDLAMYVGKDSPHAMEDFGCTVCHGGRGRGTDFTTSAHTPSSAQQAKEWRKKYQWEPMKDWEEPMLPLPNVQASCLKCHSGQTVIKGAERLNVGLNLIEKAGCYNCHAIERYKGWPKTGPDLTKIASKVDKQWAYHWIEDPHALRPNTWMPAFFQQSNNSDPVSIKRTQQEIHAITAYLYSQSREYPLKEMPVKGDVKRGEEIVSSVGCLGCHRLEPAATKAATRDALRREHGPNLIGLAGKTSEKWIYQWLKDPKSYHSETQMPNLRLSDQEAADVAAFLVSLGNGKARGGSVPPVDAKVVDEITLEFLKKSDTTAVAEKKLSQMNLQQKLVFDGKNLIRHYGCFSCHNIAGFEKDKPIGTELTEEGSKSIERLDFGFVPIDHTKPAWFRQKLKDPRIFDQGKVKTPYEALRMPNYQFSDEQINAIVTALLGFVKEKPESKMVARTPRNLSIEEGQRIVRKFNCQGCHLIEGEGGAIQTAVKDWLVRYENHAANEAEALVTSFSPPNLIGEGKKVQTKWLFDFLHQPTPIRPWLKARMPTYGFDTEDLNALVKYFSALDGEEFPFAEKPDLSLSAEQLKSAQQLFSKNYFDCTKCHIVGDKMPAGSPENWAPNFELAKDRLKPEWIIQWLTNPQDLLPGTKMPTYFDPSNFDTSGPDDVLNGDEHEQIRVLRNYLMTLSPSTEPDAAKVNHQPQAKAEEAPEAPQTAMKESAQDAIPQYLRPWTDTN